MESVGFNNDRGTFHFYENFCYERDMSIDVRVVSVGKKDDFNNYPFKLLVKIDKKTVSKFAFHKVPIWPKKNEMAQGSGGVSIGVFVKEFNNSFLNLIADIQEATSKAIEAYNETADIQCQPYYSQFNFETPQFIKQSKTFSKKPENKNKVKGKFNTGIDVQVYLNKHKICTTKITRVVDGVQENVTNATVPLTRPVINMYKEKSSEITTKSFNLFKVIYGKDVNELCALSDERLSRYNQLLDESSFVEELKGHTAIVLFASLGDVKSNFGRPFSSWKLNLCALAIEPSANAVSEAMDEMDDILKGHVAAVAVQPQAGEDDDFDAE